MDPGWGGWGGGDGGGHEYVAPGPNEQFAFNEAHLRELVQAGNFEGVDFYLSRFTMSVDPLALYMETGTDPATFNPVLFLYGRQQELLNRIDAQNFAGAQAFYNRWLEPLAHVSGARFPYSDFVRNRVELLGNRLLERDGWTPWPNQEFVDKLMMQMLDYIRLYFPEFIGHEMREGRRTQNLWQLSMVLRDANGDFIKNGSKYQYRCLACTDWTGGSSSGIKQLEYHLVGAHNRGAPACNMMTPLLYEMLGVQDPYIEVQEDGMINMQQNDDANEGPVPEELAHEQDEEQGVPEELAHEQDEEQGVLEELAHEQDEEQGEVHENINIAQQNANAHPVHPPQHYIHATVVLSYHGRMSWQLDQIISSVVNAQPMVLPAATLVLLVGCRSRLQKILRWCNQPAALQAGQLELEVVSAVDVWNEIRHIRHTTLGQLEDLFQMPVLRPYFQTLQNEIAALESECLSAMVPQP